MHTRFLSVLCTLLLALSGEALAQEAPVFASSSATIPGTVIGDLCYDFATDQVLTVDLMSGETRSFTRALQPIGTLPSAFPPGSVSVGLTTEAATGRVFWLVIEPTNGALQLWSSLNVTIAPTLVGPVTAPPNAFPAGMDAPDGIGNTLLFSDLAGASTNTIDFNGAQTRPPLPNPFGPSFGLAHAQGPWITLGGDPMGTGLPTQLLTSHGINGNPIDAIGVAFPAGQAYPVFDYGPMTPAGARSMYWAQAGLILRVPVQRSFIRGDFNSDRAFDITDLVALNNWLFGGGAGPTCLDAADANDDGAANIADSLFMANVLLGVVPLAPPFPDCGYDPTPDPLRCDAGFAGCP